ncbi:VWA domain-containing protein [Bacillus sp. RG28]|uniref:VWA domain-containing protein n=1 Tax=Gottfriedia endophytica TaxID=2820819 RepID=A0A940NJV0_9BACI|nr:VWA domain-containing protein [Gottfriedia endophytica]MBP0726639.1 VWA domain-containing protein [Gottfriedia endophytica]
MANKGKFLIVSVISLIALFLIVFVSIKLFGKEEAVKITDKNKSEVLANLYKDIDVKKVSAKKGQIDLNPADIASELPDINKFPISVKNSTDSYVEIFSSTEKSGTGTDGWLNEVANDFNKTNFILNGKPVSVKIRNIASGTATDYIKSGKYIPDAFTPSNELWAEIIKANNVHTELISKRIVGNVPGIVISKSKYNALMKKYGKVNAKSVIQAMSNNEFAMGYTDPYASSTGLNFLLTALNTFDSSNILSDKAEKGFENFQSNVPFTASTTIQMREAAKSGALDGFVLEYQSFQNSPDLKDSYVFTPFGLRHDSPLYALGELPKEKLDIIKKFAEFTKQEKYQNLAKKYGFNALNDYVSELKTIDGNTLSAAQKLWKVKKNGANPIAAVFVADISGSMDGEPLRRLKESLLKGQKYLGRENSIGLVTYSDNVTLNLPIAKYTTNQQSKFVGAVESLQTEGGTATFDGILVAMKMLEDEVKKNPNVRPLIFVLTDGETNQGHTLGDVKGLIKAYKTPIYTIGYNANIKVLESVSSINEAANINADSDDVVYKIKNLLNVQM